MEAVLQVYAFRTRQFTAKVSAIQPAADPETQRYTIVLDLENPPENLMAGMTGEMNIITGTHKNVPLVPTRALIVDQALIVKNGVVRARTVKVGYKTLDFSEIISGLSEGDRVVLSDQDKLRPGNVVRQRAAKIVRPPD
jgi:RND family efflux transporter MFP subunit